MKKNKIFVLSGPSGSGKSTLIDYCLKEFPQILNFSISTTTRNIRQGEKEGINYFFVSKEKFEILIENDKLIEYQKIYDNYYGTTKKSVHDILDKNSSVIMDIDVYGKANFDKNFPNSIGILIEPPSFEILEERLIKRGREDIEHIKKRLQIAKTEIEFAKTKGKYKYSIINAKLDDAKKELNEIIKLELNLT